MKVIRLSEITSKVNKRGVMTKTLVEHPSVTVKNLYLNSGDTIPNHSVAVEVFFYVVKGTGTIVIGDSEAVVKETDIVICPKNIEMAVRADQGVDFSFLNVKTPSLK